ncbi:MAG: hypothetical protein HY207_05275 [Nitrospirae bacterium]|nr:hypothetical protein [Nitrospirota bacterium]
MDAETFSSDEVDFLKQAALFSWKELITKKIRRALETLHDELAKELVPEALLAPEGMDFTRWQVVRGERLEGRPYAYLDFPQYFSRETKFTYRTMFWWGSGLFFAMILEGPALDRYREHLLGAYPRLADHGLALSLAETPWEWKREGPSVLPLQVKNRAEVTEALAARRFLKLQSCLELEALACEPGAIVRKGVEVFRLLREVVAREPRTDS